MALVAVDRFVPGSTAAGAFLVGGIVGAIFAALIMDWAIVVLSCLVGAALVVGPLGLGDLTSLLVYAGLVTVGIIVQARLMRGPKTARPAGPR